jgi:hypothetical protein
MFQTLNVEQRIETLDFDFVSLMAAIGGNLGLFLGLSVLSLTMSLISCLKTLARMLCLSLDKRWNAGRTNSTSD